MTPELAKCRQLSAGCYNTPMPEIKAVRLTETVKAAG